MRISAGKGSFQPKIEVNPRGCGFAQDWDAETEHSGADLKIDGGELSYFLQRHLSLDLSRNLKEKRTSQALQPVHGKPINQRF